MTVSHSCCIFMCCTSMTRFIQSSTCRVLWCIEIWWLWRIFQDSELIVMFKKPDCILLNFVRRFILLKAAIRRWIHYSHKGMDMASNNTWVGCGRKLSSVDTKGGLERAHKTSLTPLRHHNQPKVILLLQAEWIHAFMFMPNSEPAIVLTCFTVWFQIAK